MGSNKSFRKQWFLKIPLFFWSIVVTTPGHSQVVSAEVALAPDPFGIIDRTTAVRHSSALRISTHSSALRISTQVALQASNRRACRLVIGNQEYWVSFPSTLAIGVRSFPFRGLTGQPIRGSEIFLPNIPLPKAEGCACPGDIRGLAAPILERILERSALLPQTDDPRRSMLTHEIRIQIQLSIQELLGSTPAEVVSKHPPAEPTGRCGEGR